MKKLIIVSMLFTSCAATRQVTEPTSVFSFRKAIVIEKGVDNFTFDQTRYVRKKGKLMMDAKKASVGKRTFWLLKATDSTVVVYGGNKQITFLK